jgi:hypothetical protein
MFHIEHDRLIASLELIRKRLCAYFGGNRCDCKYIPRDGKIGDMCGEVSGCCEIAMAIDLLRGDDAKKKEAAAYDRGVADERARCANVVDPVTGPISHKTCNAFTCLAAAQHMISAGLNPAELTMPKRTRKAKKAVAQ